MANYKIFEPLLLKQEGGYANKKNDRGGETWMGIARNFYPQAKIWPIIDANKSHRPSDDHDGWKVFSIYLQKLPELQKIVDDFYEVEFWDHMKGDLIANQSIANFIGDWGVNCGLRPPIEHCQKLLGLTQDGGMGPLTLAALNSSSTADFFSKLKKERIDFYHAVVEAHPEDKEFLSGWIERTNSFNFSA